MLDINLEPERWSLVTWIIHKDFSGTVECHIKTKRRNKFTTINFGDEAMSPLMSYINECRMGSFAVVLWQSTSEIVCWTINEFLCPRSINPASLWNEVSLSFFIYFFLFSKSLTCLFFVQPTHCLLPHLLLFPSTWLHTSSLPLVWISSCVTVELWCKTAVPQRKHFLSKPKGTDAKLDLLLMFQISGTFYFSKIFVVGCVLIGEGKINH